MVQSPDYYLDLADQDLGRVSQQDSPARSAEDVAVAQVHATEAVAAALAQLAEALSEGIGQ